MNATALAPRIGEIGPEAHDRETALLARLRAGEAGAFEALVDRFGGRMYATARRLLG